jgi:transposase InsO family protein
MNVMSIPDPSVSGTSANSIKSLPPAQSGPASSTPDTRAMQVNEFTLTTTRLVKTSAAKLLVLQGTIAGASCTFLIDTGASRSFISTSFAAKFTHKPPVKHVADKVRLADGTHILSDAYFPRARFHLGTYSCIHDFHTVPLSEFDVVLGKDWLNTISPVTFDFQRNVMSFKAHGRRHVLRSPRESALVPSDNFLSIMSFKRALRKPGTELYVVQCKDFQPSSNSVSSPAPRSVMSPADPVPLVDLSDLHKQFADVLQPPAPGLPPERPGYDFQIDTIPGSAPPSCAPMRLAPPVLEYLKQDLEEMVANGYIRPSTSPYAAPLFYVKKKDDAKLRMVLDYRALNAVTIKNKYPLPNIDDLLNQLHGAKVFTKLDLAAGYYQLRMHPDSVAKTAFTTRYGSFEFLVMPMGLSNAPSAFQRLVNDIFRPYLDKFVQVYLDDILIYSRTPEEHKVHVRKVLQLLKDNHLHVKPSKCKWAVPAVDYLGHTVTGEGIGVDPRKVQAITDWPAPANQQQLYSFLGLANYYRRFIHDYAKIALPLYSLLGSKATWQWTPDHDSAFASLKQALSSAPLLATPDFSKPFVVQCDASDFAIGSVLSQGTDADHRVIAYESRKLKDAETRYLNHDKELLSVVHALRTWRHLLIGSPFTVRVLTDNTPAKFVLSKKATSLNRRQTAWLDFFADFDFTLEHVPGTANVVADALSRRPDHAPSESSLFSLIFQTTLDPPAKQPSDFLLFALHSSTVAVQPTRRQTSLLKAVRAAGQKDREYADVLHAVRARSRFDFSIKDGVLYRNSKAGSQLYVPAGPLRHTLLHEAHDAPFSGHLGRHKTLQRLQQHYYWPYMDLSVREYTRSCPSCQRNKPSSQPPLGLLQPIPVPERNWQSVSLDLITCLPKTSSGHDSILVVVDRLSKMLHAIPTTIHATSADLARVFHDNIFKLHGLPQQLISDRDTRFTADFWSSLFKTLGTKLSFSTANHPQTDGQTERANRTIEEMLRSYVSPFQDDWDQHLAAAEFAYNSGVHASTGYTPFFLNYGFTPDTPASLLAPSATSVPPASGAAFASHMTDLVNSARTALIAAQQTMARYYNQHRRDHQFRVGDKVMLSASHFSNLPAHAQTAIRKLGPVAYGPFPVTEVISPLAYRLKLHPRMKIHDVLPISRLRPYHDGSVEFPDRVTDMPPPPDIIDGEKHIHVQAFLKERQHYGYQQFLVKYSGMDDAANEWQFAADLQEDLDPAYYAQLLSAFKAKNTAK